MLQQTEQFAGTLAERRDLVVRGRNELLKAIITPQDCNLDALSAMIATLSARSCEKRENEKRRDATQGASMTEVVTKQDQSTHRTTWMRSQRARVLGKGAKDILSSLMAHVSSCYEKGLKESDC